MTVSRADLERLQRLDAQAPDDGSNMAGLNSVEAVLGYVAAAARRAGDDEADCCELAARSANLDAPAVRHAASILGRLGYRLVADRLRQIAGRRKSDLVPLT